MNAVNKFLLTGCTAMLVTLTAVKSQAQSLREFFQKEETPLIYLGVDFSLTKIQGEAATAAEIQDKFEPINSVIITETKKYDIAEAFRRSTVTNDLEAIKKVNDAISADKIKTDNIADVEKGLTPADIGKHVSAYKLSGKKGIGLVFIMDGMSKANKEAYVYVTLLDLATKKVLLTERITGKAQGFGFRNYWAYTIFKVLNSIDKGKYNDWKKKAVEEPVVRTAMTAATGTYN
ncbi:hypothetical protein [Chitinophaga tropicalis]|uniref:Uncharacterized protein n=1 Tax=Chitinophaga tropicalis TaxID=2683588 RepID=A0A7K1UBN3_9BACT|nr:hypothetical protein [Chitinophaga tropicalis]MVT11801.1 hypothetical protein [Chitinophaga tropicalis]